jgi:predicted lipoprotein with Yx(FWY)xxD motif
MIALGALLAAACGSSSSSSQSTSSGAGASTQPTTTAVKVGVSLQTRTLPGVGSVLANGQGRTLYIFVPDAAKNVTCTGGCAAAWPPLSIPSGQTATATGAVKRSLISSDPDPSGGRVVTYNGWPLYLYVADPNPGTDNGEGINSSGGLWYVIAPSGKVVKTKASGAGGSSTSSSGGSTY